MNRLRISCVPVLIVVLMIGVPAHADREVLSKTEAKCQQAVAQHAIHRAR